MTSTPRQQQGASIIVALIILAIIGIGVFFGLQYIPQSMESGKVDKILSNVEKDHGDSRFKNTREIESRISNQLNIDEMNDMMSNIKVTEEGEGFVIKVYYERELNLIYETKIKPYEKVLILK
jgi:hypothetical protein